MPFRSPSLRRFLIGHAVFWIVLVGFAGASLAMLKDWPWTSVVLGTVLWAFPGIVVTSVAAWIGRHTDGLSRYVAGWVAITALWFGTVALLQWWLSGEFYDARAAWTTATFIAIVVLLWVVLAVLLRQLTRTEEERLAAVVAEAQAKEASLRALRYQLQPHFLFNAMNSVAAAIGENPKRAQQMLSDLAGLLRSTLDSGEQGTFEEELARLKLYLAVEKARFEERLQVSFDVSSDVLDEALPPLLLQPLLENAIRHGMHADATLEVQVCATLQGEVLQIRVSHPGELAPDRNEGHGLESVRKRLAAFAPGRSRFELTHAQGWIHAEVRIG